MKQKYFLFWLLIANFSLFAQNATHLNFDGVDDYVSLPKAFFSDFTIEYWIKTSSAGTTGSQWYNGKSIVDNEVGGVTTDFGTSIVGNKLAFGIGYPDTTIFSTSNINDGNWNHIAVSWKQSTGEMKLYINGILESSALGSKESRNASNIINLATNNYLGSFFNGNIDDLRIWNIARTDAQILESKDCELAGTEEGLVSYYKFNQGVDALDNSTVTTLTDATANANNGTLSGFALTGSTSNWVAGSPIITGKTCTSLSTSSFVEATKVSIYPNPSSGIFTIETKEDVKVDVYDILGKKIVTKSFNSGANGLDVTKYANGIYLVNVITKEGNQTTYRIVKE